ncbi:MAG: helix-turn-helix domain-containing protein [Actinophytocola sp.]|uniref:helix-turn-helix domain-containing protein n=1 Tax=Actinophytocola sp. TaxID=1872138 RepID=UPI003C77EA44
MGVSVRQETYLPDVDEEQVAQVHDFLTAHQETGRGRPDVPYFLSGKDPGDRVELPEELYRVLRKVVQVLQAGLAVTIAPATQTLTTQQAAELLGVSRPTVVRLIDEGHLPHEKVGSHRRIQLRDLLAYRDERRTAQYLVLEATAVDVDDDLGDTLRNLRAARREVAKRHRGEPAG